MDPIQNVLVQNDYSAYLAQLQELTKLGTLIAGLLVFFTVVILCHYTYKFFHIFF